MTKVEASWRDPLSFALRSSFLLNPQGCAGISMLLGVLGTVMLPTESCKEQFLPIGNSCQLWSRLSVELFKVSSDSIAYFLSPFTCKVESHDRIISFFKGPQVEGPLSHEHVDVSCLVRVESWSNVLAPSRIRAFILGSFLPFGSCKRLKICITPKVDQF